MVLPRSRALLLLAALSCTRPEENAGSWSGTVDGLRVRLVEIGNASSPLRLALDVENTAAGDRWCEDEVRPYGPPATCGARLDIYVGHEDGKESWARIGTTHPAVREVFQARTVRRLEFHLEWAEYEIVARRTSTLGKPTFRAELTARWQLAHPDRQTALSGNASAVGLDAWQGVVTAPDLAPKHVERLPALRRGNSDAQGPDPRETASAWSEPLDGVRIRLVEIGAALDPPRFAIDVENLGTHDRTCWYEPPKGRLTAECTARLAVHLGGDARNGWATVGWAGSLLFGVTVFPARSVQRLELFPSWAEYQRAAKRTAGSGKPTFRAEMTSSLQTIVPRARPPGTGPWEGHLNSPPLEPRHPPRAPRDQGESPQGSSRE